MPLPLPSLFRSYRHRLRPLLSLRRRVRRDGSRLRFPRVWYFNEFVLELPARADRVIHRLLEKNIAAGFPLDRYYEGMENSLLVAVTEKRTKEEIDYLAHALEVSL